MLHVDDAKGIPRIEDAYTNWYLVESDGQLTIVDTGVPASWDSLYDALGQLGRSRRPRRDRAHARARRPRRLRRARVLTGHGEPSHAGAREIATRARARGVT